MSSNPNEDRRISKGKVVASKDVKEEASAQTELNIDSFF